jgi:hypothetical protein
MKLKLSDIFQSKDSLVKLANSDLPIKTAYNLSKLVKKLNEEYQNLEDFRVELVRKHGNLEEGNYRVPQNGEQFDNFIKEYNDFMQTEIEIDVPEIEVPIEDIKIKLTPMDVINIEKFVKLAE